MARFKQDKLVDSIGIAFIWKNHILLTKNPKEKEFEHSLSIPKGRQEEHEVGLPFATALREVKEEIGIEVPLNWIIDKNITDIHLESGKRIRYYIVEIENLSDLGLSDKMIPTDQYQKEEIDFAGFIDFESAKKFIRKDQVNILRDCMRVRGYKSKETIEMTVENENPQVQSIVFGAPSDEYSNNPKVKLNDEELYRDKTYYLFQIFYNHNAILILFKDKSILEKGNNRNVLEFLDRKGVHIDRSQIKVKEITGLSISNALNKFFIQIDEPINYEVNEQFDGEFYEVIWKRKYYSPFKIKNKEPQKLKEGGELLAPNRKKSNLTYEQYQLVRTPEFKEWFGDWENNPKNASKVVDENGEPIVVYHGTENNIKILVPQLVKKREDGSKEIDAKKMREIADSYFAKINSYPFTIFEQSEKRHIGTMEDFAHFFFTGNKKIADSYAHAGTRTRGFEDFHDNIEIDENGDLIQRFFNVDKLHSKLGIPYDISKEELIIEAEKKGVSIRDKEYMRGMTRLIAKKENMHDLRYSDLEEFKGYDFAYMNEKDKENDIRLGSVYGFVGSYFLNLKNPLQKNFEGKIWSEEIDGKTMNDFINEAYKNSRDGAIIYNVIDKGSMLSDDIISDNYIAFNSNNIKLADGTNTTFNSNTDDIRLREGGVIEGQLHSECNDDDGCGEKFTVNQTGKVIEAERDEAVISDDTFRERNLACPVGGCQYRIIGYIPQIASALNVMGGGKSFDPGAEIYELSTNERLTKFESVPKDTNTDVDRNIDSSSIVINRRSMADPNRYEVIGTAKQIASSINSIDGNGKVIETGGIIKKL